MARFTLDEANAWTESTKLTLDDINIELAAEVETQILSRIATVYDTSGWTNNSNTPELVRTILAMEYAAWIIDRSFSDDADETNSYARLLRTYAEANISSILAGTVTIAELDTSIARERNTPSFFPNDQSSSREPSAEFPSDGPPAFMMGSVF